MKNFKRLPNGGLINVSVSSLQMALATCRSIAESAMQKKEEDAKLLYGALREIVEEVRETLHGEEKRRLEDDGV